MKPDDCGHVCRFLSRDNQRAGGSKDWRLAEQRGEAVGPLHGDGQLARELRHRDRRLRGPV